VLSFVASTILFLITEFIMNRFNRFIITVLFGLFTSQAFALDFTRATKDTKFIVSDTNNVIRVYLDNFSAMQISAIPLKNSAGTQILFTHMFVASASNGVGDSSDELIKLGHITLQENTTLYKIWDVAIGANCIAEKLSKYTRITLLVSLTINLVSLVACVKSRANACEVNRPNKTVIIKRLNLFIINSVLHSKRTLLYTKFGMWQ
jgi:hypothetical protein